MTNILDAVNGIFSTNLGDESNNPMHIGEVMNTWTYHIMLTEANRFAEMALNTTNDNELKEALKKSIIDCHNQADEIDNLFKNEGISMPPTSERKPHSDPNDIPIGAKMTDDEIANGISVKLVSALNFCTLGLTQSIRTDLASMWLRFFLKRAEYSAYYMPIMKKRGWIKIPPYYYAPGNSK
ncbi:MAG: DUF3231 family protein [Firmicutes bacterium]|nr:DUF3231 family protein [Bacillota bacterium]